MALGFKTAKDIAKKAFDAATKASKDYIIMSTKFENLEKQFDRLEKNNEKFLEKILNENECLRRRVTALEGCVDATFHKSTKEAVTNMLKEVLEGGKLGVNNSHASDEILSHIQKSLTTSISIQQPTEALPNQVAKTGANPET